MLLKVDDHGFDNFKNVMYELPIFYHAWYMLGIVARYARYLPKYLSVSCDFAAAVTFYSSKEFKSFRALYAMSLI